MSVGRAKADGRCGCWVGVMLSWTGRVNTKREASADGWAVGPEGWQVRRAQPRLGAALWRVCGQSRVWDAPCACGP